MISRVKFASIPVTNQDRSLAFFTEQVGMTLVSDQPMGPGQRWIELAIPDADTRIVLFTPDEHKDWIGTFSNVAFGSNDVEATYAELVERGVPFVEPPTAQPWGTYAIFSDPDGNKFLISSLD